ncbi:MAG: penicillin-binding transpeptidase domain-containing protein [Candidatus Hinthialibacter antarcticus]|nr:penicillin-binding transpeptidase domain-containing protein [Candidatus Hinthialibacter antarcticus]
MKRYPCFLLLSVLLLLTPIAVFAFDADADVSSLLKGFDGCFVLHNLQSGQTLKHNASRCDQRMPPCSTFKIPHALVALELGVVKNPDDVVKWDGSPQIFKSWERDHNLYSAIENSVVWYFQRIAEKVGYEKEREYLEKFDYGNKNADRNLTSFWLDQGPLEITANEQIAFLKKFHENTLPVSQRSFEIVKKAILFKQTDEYILRGKTGSGRFEQGGGFGWYVGILECGDDAYLFATNIEGAQNASGKTAREITIKILTELEMLDG